MEIGVGAVACFWLEPTGEAQLSLRRFTFGVDAGEEPRARYRACDAAEPREGDGYREGCDASVMLDDRIRERRETQGDGYAVLKRVARRAQPLHRDPRWPAECERCGQPFKRTDTWQVNQHGIHVREDTGAEVAFRGYGGHELAGGLFGIWWRHGYRVIDEQGAERGFVGPDGIALGAICPNGLTWEVDGPATGGGHWTRTGEPRYAVPHARVSTVFALTATSVAHGCVNAIAFTPAAPGSP